MTRSAGGPERFPWKIIFYNLLVFMVMTILNQVISQALFNYDRYPIPDFEWSAVMLGTLYYWLPFQVLFNVIRAAMVAGNSMKRAWAYLVSIPILLVCGPVVVLIMLALMLSMALG